jgi:hypothetical protein
MNCKLENKICASSGVRSDATVAGVSARRELKRGRAGIVSHLRCFAPKGQYSVDKKNDYIGTPFCHFNQGRSGLIQTLDGDSRVPSPLPSSYLRNHSVRHSLLFFCVSLLFLVQPTFGADTGTEGRDRFILFLQSLPLQSGEMKISVTEYYGTTPGKKLTSPRTDTYHAVWDGSDIFLGKYTSDLSTNTNTITGLLVGRRDNFHWDAFQLQLDLYIKTNGAAYDPNTDDNQVTFFVNDAEASVRKYLMGGFELTNMHWTGAHLSAQADTETIEANLLFNTNAAELAGSVRSGNFSTEFRIDYFAFGRMGEFLYPRKYSIYLKDADKGAFELVRTIDITELTAPRTNRDREIFSPSAHLNTNSFGTFLYVSNVQYFVSTDNQLLHVRSTVASQIENPQNTFIKLVIVFSVMFLPLALWIGLKMKEKSRQPAVNLKTTNEH